MNMPLSRPSVLLVDMMSGSNDYGRELALSLATRCHLTVVTVDDSPLIGQAGLRCLGLFPAFGGRASKLGKLGQSLRAYLQLVRELWRHRRGAVHVQFFRFGWVDMLLYLCCLPWLRCLVYTAHNTLPHEPTWWHRRAYRLWYRSVHTVHVLSSHAQAGVVALANVPLSQVVVVPHGNYQALRTRTAQAALPTLRDWGVPAHHRVGLVFGLVREYKGVDRLIEAATRLPASLPLTLVVAGGGPEQLFEQYVQLARQLGVGHRFVFRRGYVPDDTLAGLLRVSDFAVFPYRHIYQSGALMLAMTFGVPMVTADLPGFREYVTHGREAMMCDCADPVALSDALQAITLDDAKRQAMAAAAKHLADTRYDWGAIADGVLALYVNTRG